MAYNCICASKCIYYFFNTLTVYKASTIPIYFNVSATTTAYLTSVATSYSSFPHSLQLEEVRTTVVIARTVQCLPVIRPFPALRRLGVPAERTSQESRWETGGLQTLIAWDIYRTLAENLHTLPWTFWNEGQKKKTSTCNLSLNK